MAGHFVVEPLDDVNEYDPIIRPPTSEDETTLVLGDPIGLTRLFLLLIGNRDSKHSPKKAARGHNYANALSNAAGLFLSKIGILVNFVKYRLTMDNSERGGSLKNIHAHYDLSNDLFTTFLDTETLMYSSAIYDAVRAPSPQRGLQFRGSLEEAQWRKLDTLLDRAQIKAGQTMLDIGFGWGGLSIHAAKKYGCNVTGITLSVEQKALAEARVAKEGVGHLITFEVIDYRTFARRPENAGKFDRVLSCEMIEAVGHEHLGEFFWVVEQVLAPDGILVMEAITTPEARYETYRRSTDFINTIIFPGSCCPSLHALMDAAYQQSSLTLEHIDNIGLHYAQTLAEWRRRFNASEKLVRQLGFDDVFLRVWNYYLTYCEAGFHSQTENCLILVWSRPGCQALLPLCETRVLTQAPQFSAKELQQWTVDGSSN
jgi:cyclopropane-fatty-acyl-phospholipid synthase